MKIHYISAIRFSSVYVYYIGDVAIVSRSACYENISSEYAMRQIFAFYEKLPFYLKFNFVFDWERIFKLGALKTFQSSCTSL